MLSRVVRVYFCISSYLSICIGIITVLSPGSEEIVRSRGRRLRLGAMIDPVTAG